MKKFLFVLIASLLIFTGCSNNKNINNKEEIEEEINWYIQFDEDNDYLMCDNNEFDKENGFCKVGTYKIIQGNFEENISIELCLDHYYKDGGYIAVDSDSKIINLERIEKYKNSIVSIEKESNEVYMVKPLG